MEFENKEAQKLATEHKVYYCKHCWYLGLLVQHTRADGLLERCSYNAEEVGSSISGHT